MLCAEVREAIEAFLTKLVFSACVTELDVLLCAEVREAIEARFAELMFSAGTGELDVLLCADVRDAFGRALAEMGRIAGFAETDFDGFSSIVSGAGAAVVIKSSVVSGAGAAVDLTLIQGATDTIAAIEGTAICVFFAGFSGGLVIGVAARKSAGAHQKKVRSEKSLIGFIVHACNVFVIPTV